MLKKLLIGVLLVTTLFPFPVAASPVTLLQGPVLLEPADMAEITYISHPPLAIPNFSWAPVLGATQYEIQISSDIAFGTGNIKTVSTANTTYTPIKSIINNFLYDGEFYWRVRVKAPTVGAWSEQRSFSKRWATPSADPPNRPALLFPAPGAAVQFLDYPGFSWSPVPGAAKYRLEIDDEQDFTTLVYYAENFPNTSHQPLLKLANGTYYWRVIPFDIANTRGAESEIGTFIMAYGTADADRPQLLSPANGSEPLFTPTFEWRALRGVQYYQLQYSTDETFQSGVTTVETRATSHSISQLPNDVNVYWRVRARSNNSYSEWSEIWMFQKHWYIEPQLLTPTNGYRHVYTPPVFRWTPVPGAAYYKLTVGCDLGFTINRTEYSVLRPYYVIPNWSNNYPKCSTWYWKVTPYHGNGPAGKESAIWSFDRQLTYDNPAPQLVFPAPYYNPDLYVASHGPEAKFDVHTVPTASLPIFGWAMSVVSEFTLAEQYRIEVDDSATFVSPNWVMTTTNPIAAPDWSNPFTPTVGQDYYWRVRALDANGTPYASSPTTGWSQRWLARFDPSWGLTPRAETTPLLLRPTHGDQAVEQLPLLEWWPVAGATRYQVQVARDAAFTHDAFTAWAQYAVYAYPHTPAYGTYYWRVQAWDDQGALGAWSAPRRFQIAAQNRWRLVLPSPMIFNGYTHTLVAQSPVLGTPGDLVNLYAANDLRDWAIGFDVVSSTQPIDYVILFDSNQVDAAGVATDPVFGLPVTEAHYPEYAIHLKQGAGSPTDGYFTYNEAFFYSYNSVTNQWNVPVPLDTVGTFDFIASGAYTSVMPLDGFVQVKIRLATVGAPGCLSVMVLTATPGGALVDTLPPALGAELDNFTTVSETPMLIAPPTNLSGDPKTYPSLPLLHWQHQVDTRELRYGVQIALDSAFTSIAHTADSTTLIFAHAYVVPDNDLSGDNTYFWRVRLHHKEGTITAASQHNAIPWRLERRGLIAPNVEVSTLASSVTFSWGKVEGVSRFRLEWSSDPGFGTFSFVDNLHNWQYTLPALLSPGVYYWRVRPVNWKAEASDWVYGDVFTINLPLPTGLRVTPVGIAPDTPTLRWDPLLLPSGTPRFSAYRYKVQICQDEAMTQGCRTTGTTGTEQHSWSPPFTFNDGELFWRVHIVDGSNNTSAWTPVQSFTKQYPSTTLIAPVQGADISETPTFIWETVPTMPQYRIEIANNPFFSPMFDAVDTAATQYTPLKTLPTQQYYWRVCTRDRDNKAGPCTDATLYFDPYPYRVYLPLVMRGK